MKRTAIATFALVTMLAGFGCSTPHRAAVAEVEGPQRVYLASFGPAVPLATQRSGLFRLGAGDVLGEAIFASYVAHARAARNGEVWANVGAAEDARPE